ncbi:mitochondrial inner membrane protease subunit 1 [Senna tora]|uniref:Mitochondrial inner membrane protease subunit 1 n=1 Tax=Senna tora TaxID=362788 RepID=A0A834SIK0_9FABA|nr:mitochondrial inner membrane protease subunit 1 [Senna tora]
MIGLEGDSITYVVDPKTSDECKTTVLPKGHIWIEGDNIYDSTDSRKFGPVPYGLLCGKAFWKVWPPKTFGRLGKN